MLWMIYAEDRDDGLPIRMANREAHLAYVADFPLIVAGPILDGDGTMRGSVLVVDMPTLGDVDAFIAGDPYTTAGLTKDRRVWAFRQTAGSVSIGG